MVDSNPITIKRALISVSDKTGIVELAQTLRTHQIEILSTGGTYRLLKENGIEVVEVSQYTQFPEMMDGRVKTLHPKIHGGILARRGTDEEVMDTHGINAIDLVVVNLYPFEQTVANPAANFDDEIENIDIGGPTMVRSSAKNFKYVSIVVNPANYARVIHELEANGGAISYQARLDFAAEAFAHTAAYDGAIANHLGKKIAPGSVDFPRTFDRQYTKAQEMRYGENPHQKAAFYRESNPAPDSIAAALQIQGKELSFNNVADTDAALETVKLFSDPACVIVKHANPCGVAEGETLLVAYEKAFATDPESAFGGIIAFNRELDAATAKAIIDKQFVEVIIASGVCEETKSIIAEKKNVRLLSCGELSGSQQARLDLKKVNGGLLIQDQDLSLVSASELNFVSKRQPSDDEIQDMLFAWKVAKMVKSNAIVYAKDSQTIGVGAGQMSRVNSARIAAIKADHAGLEVKGAAMASDAFFPFRDGIDNAASVGITSIIQPGGSIRDEEVIAAADEHNIAMAFTGMRHFRH